jgi:branched-chain amino acid aminotransferase
VASCNSTNFFIVRGGELWTSTGACNVKGITQASVLAAWRADGGVARECDFTLAQVYNADEAFVTGTLGGVTPVVRVDGRPIGKGEPGPLTARASTLYLAAVAAV